MKRQYMQAAAITTASYITTSTTTTTSAETTAKTNCTKVNVQGLLRVKSN